AFYCGLRLCAWFRSNSCVVGSAPSGPRPDRCVTIVLAIGELLEAPMRDFPLGLTYDDVLLVPRRSRIASRREVDTSTCLTRELKIAIPALSANMDTVTEAPMAEAMAREGGIGIIHRFMPIAEEAAQVARVKRPEE